MHWITLIPNFEVHSLQHLPLAGKTSSCVLNSKHFDETMRDITVGEDELLVSFDVSSLFTNVSIGEAVQVIQAKLREDDSPVGRTPLSPDRVAELLDMCLEVYLLQLWW